MSRGGSFWVNMHKFIMLAVSCGSLSGGDQDKEVFMKKKHNNNRKSSFLLVNCSHNEYLEENNAHFNHHESLIIAHRAQRCC